MSRTVVCAMLVVVGAAASAHAQPKPSEAVGVAPLPVRAQPENVFERAKTVKANLSVWSERMGKSMQDLDQLRGKLDLRQVDAQKLVRDDIRSVLGDVRIEAEAILAARDRFTLDFRLYRQAVRQAPGAFEAIAKEFERKASQEPDLFLREQYADFAKIANKLAKHYAERLKKLDALEIDTAKKMALVERSVPFCNDLERFVDALPATKEGLEVERLVKRINDFITVFGEALDHIKSTCNTIAEPEPARSPGEQQRELPKVGEAATQPISLSEYRAGLDSLRQ
jgi:hypothetical protein